MTEKPEAILFDMDGVLMNSVDVWLLAINKTLIKYKVEPFERAYFIKKFWGYDVTNLFNKIGIDINAVKMCNNIYKENIEKVTIYNNVISTLKKLKNYDKGIITNTPKKQTDILLKKFNIKKYFITIVTSDDVKFAKPDPEIIFKSCKLLNVNPKNVVTIGDTMSDIESGNAAGCKVIGLNIKSEFSIKKISELPDLIKNIGELL